MSTKVNLLFLIALLAATLHCSTAQTTHVVGVALGWQVPPGGAVAYTTWASRQTFTVGDFLVFNFTTGTHDVAEVSLAAFDACNTTSPISTSNNGPTNITLISAGAHFYICTFTRHCGLGQKLAITVSAAPSTTPAATPQPSPSPAPISAPTPSPVFATPAPSPSRAPETYVVGDGLGWSVPPGGPIAYQTWARNKTFMVGDILVFNFASGRHNVAEMTSKAAYDSCNTSAASTPITSSPARITLTSPGEHFYTCTFPQHCSLGQMLAINVTGTRGTPPSSSPATPPSSSSSPSPSTTPAAAPSSTVTPPSGSVVPPSSSTTPSTPSPAGVSAPPPPNSAPTFAGAALPVALLSIALTFLY